MSIIKNKWIVRYKPDEIDYKDLIEQIPNLQDWVDLLSKNIIKVYINFNKRLSINEYFLDEQSNGNTLFLNLNNINNEIYKTKNRIVTDNLFKNIKTENVNLLYPSLSTDKRWNSIELPASSIFLASGLINNEIQVDIKKLILPSKEIDKELLKYDVTGISIFEDLFIEISTYLKDFAKLYSGFIVGGGPMATLLPIRTAYHLDHINLLIRGEAEIVFPEILKLLSQGNIEQILKYKGFILNIPGLIILSDIDQINRPQRFDKFEFNLDFAKAYQLQKGLEINISRGCKRSCVFCSKVQGKSFRKVEPEKFDQLLVSMSKKIIENNFTSDECRTLNINDDDILQEKYYAREIFKIIKKNNFRIWGIQTSIQSFFNASQIDEELLSIINDKELYVKNNPLIWLGTDAFIPERGKKLSKFIPDKKNLFDLINMFEIKKINNIHYWISSDPDSNWNEFILELILIDSLRKKFKYFDILAHAPFLIPYSSTPLNKKLMKTQHYSDQIKYRKILRSKNPEYDISFTEHVLTKFKYLNKLLANEKIVGNKGFFDYLKENDRYNLYLTMYNFVKKERIESETDSINQFTKELRSDEELIENILSKF